MAYIRLQDQISVSMYQVIYELRVHKFCAPL